MRKVILGFGMSLDGYLARPDGSVDSPVMDKDTRKLMAAFFRAIDTAIMRRRGHPSVSGRLSTTRFHAGGVQDVLEARRRAHLSPGAAEGEAAALTDDLVH